MNVKKILKFYLIFSLTITGVASLSYTDTFKGYFSNSMYSSGADKYLQTNSLASTLHSINFAKTNRDYVSERSSKSTFGFEIINDPTKAFVKPGGKDVEIMQYKFKTTTETLEIKSVKLKIAGMYPEKIESVSVLDEKHNKVGNGNIVDGYLYFKNLSYKLEKNSEGILQFVVNISESSTTGERLRFDLEKPEDLEIYLDGKGVKLNSYYPIKGKYLSVAKPRAEKKEKAETDKKDLVVGA